VRDRGMSASDKDNCRVVSISLTIVSKLLTIVKSAQRPGVDVKIKTHLDVG